LVYTILQEAARISAARNLLVGKTTDNGSKLQVNGVIRSDQTNGFAIGSVTGYRRIQYGTAVADGYSILADSDGFADLYYKNSVATGQIRTNFEGQSILIFPTTTNSARIQLQSTGGGNTIFGIENSTGGDLATGTSAYSCVLGAATARDLFLITNSTQRFTINGTSGNVGIGTNNPGSVLEVRGASPLARIGITSGGYVELSDNQLSAKTSSGTASDIYINIPGAKTILNRDAGNVLIGTTTDTGNRLQVNGDIQISALSIFHSENKNVSTSSTQVSGGGIGVGAFYFAAWFNTTGGAQGVATLMARGSTVVTISISDGSGCGVSFTASSGSLFAQTTTGTVNITVTQIKN
jgi:hypothetical protein